MTRKYNITLEGTNALLMHQDNITYSEEVTKWRKDPQNKKLSVAGDDRSPAWTWLGYLYHDGKSITVPSDNIMTMLREAGTQVLTGKGKKTFKAQTQSGIVSVDPHWELSNPNTGKVYHAQHILLKLQDEPDFEIHQQVCKENGFDLFIKRARINGTSKHIRVRPIFYTWSLFGRVIVNDPAITTKVLKEIFAIGGAYKGLCDWRPSSKTPGQFGTFISDVQEV